jgi:hypothetical protein
MAVRLTRRASRTRDVDQERRIGRVVVRGEFGPLLGAAIASVAIDP